LVTFDNYNELSVILSIIMDVEKLNEEVLNFIRETRKEKGVTRKQLSDDLGMPMTTYADLENGKVNFDLKRLLKVMDYLDTGMGEMLQVMVGAKGKVDANTHLEELLKKARDIDENLQSASEEARALKVFLEKFTKRGL